MEPALWSFKLRTAETTENMKDLVGDFLGEGRRTAHVRVHQLF